VLDCGINYNDNNRNVNTYFKKGVKIMLTSDEKNYAAMANQANNTFGNNFGLSGMQQANNCFGNKFGLSGMQNAFRPQPSKLAKAKDFLKSRAHAHPEWKVTRG
jgi:hypothetical protein